MLAVLGQIEATDREIDRLVYELYGLSDEEIRIIEEATTRCATERRKHRGMTEVYHEEEHNE